MTVTEAWWQNLITDIKIWAFITYASSLTIKIKDLFLKSIFSSEFPIEIYKFSLLHFFSGEESPCWCNMKELRLKISEVQKDPWSNTCDLSWFICASGLHASKTSYGRKPCLYFTKISIFKKSFAFRSEEDIRLMFYYSILWMDCTMGLNKEKMLSRQHRLLP